MDGFSAEMQQKMHGILSDIIIEGHSAGGIPNPDWYEAEIRQALGDEVVGVTTVVHVPAMGSFQFRGQTITRQINIIGIDTETYADVSDFRRFLLHPENQRLLNFQLRETGYGEGRDDFPESGWGHRRRWAMIQKAIEQERQLREAYEAKLRQSNSPGLPSPGSDVSSLANAPPSIGAQATAGPSIGAPGGSNQLFDAEKEQHAGIVLGIGICSVRGTKPDGTLTDYFYVRPGDDIQVGLLSASSPPRILSEKFTIVDLYESKMSEYDSTFAFVPIEKLQQMRGMIDPSTGLKSVSSIQIKLRENADLDAARDILQSKFPSDMMIQVSTWKDLQGPLLAAVKMETTILNILLFLIIAVAGFGILATFFMIVVEKTRDIGVLKSLGAPSSGVASIFLGYGLLLGAVGSGVGTVGGLLFVNYINEIADVLEVITGGEVFDPKIYYFERIPTIVDPMSIVMVMLGAILIAVLASVLPALRAARLRPVESLRYE
jgi:lipoprotein-releasing system permease protein